MKLALITICNDAFIEPCRTMIYSFVKNNLWFDGDIIICCDTNEFTLNEENRAKLQMIYEHVIIREVDRSQYQKFIDNFKKDRKILKYLPSVYTFEVFDLDGYDKALYLDADMLIIESIQDLFNLDYSIGVSTLSKEYFSDFEIGVIGLYNLGLIFVNYNKSNLKKVKRDLIKAGEEIDPLKCTLYEQGVFNQNVPIETKIVDYKYNYFDEYETPYKSIIHFVHNKPWIFPEANNNTKLWKQYNDQLNSI